MRFLFSPNGFRCELERTQCAEMVKSGARCRMRCVIGNPYCWHHLLSHHNLRIKTSTIPVYGKGLFAQLSTHEVKSREKARTEKSGARSTRATRSRSKVDDADAVVFTAGDEIIEYGGELISLKENNRRYTPRNDLTAPYSYQLTDRKKDGFEDAACKRGPGSMANHSDSNVNAEFRLQKTPKKHFMLYALKDIRNGEEIFISYGDAYEFQNNYSTKG